jgi:putative transposase
MVEHPAEYLWSSYRTNAQGEPSTLLTHHPIYTALSKDEKARQAVYRELFRYQLDPGMIDEIRVATNSNYALGSQKFQAASCCHARAASDARQIGATDKEE